MVVIVTEVILSGNHVGYGFTFTMDTTVTMITSVTIVTMFTMVITATKVTAPNQCHYLEINCKLP